jgi:hypothetical protein
MKTTPIGNFFKNSVALQWFLDNYDQVEHGEEWIKEELRHDAEQVVDILETDLSVLDAYLYNKEVDMDHLLFSYHEDYWAVAQEGEVQEHEPEFFLEAGCQPEIYDLDTVKVRFLCSVPLSEELEYQAETGECAYYYAGPRYVAVWEYVGRSDCFSGRREKNTIPEKL